MYFYKFVSVVIVLHTVAALYDFPATNINIPKRERDFLNTLTENDLRHFVELGVDSVFKEQRLEQNLNGSNITVLNGTLSHNQLLETLPNAKAQDDSEIALRILKASQYIYNSKCVQNGISPNYCRQYLAEKPIPTQTVLWNECNEILRQGRDGHIPLRRLLPSNYKDGLYQMYSEDNRPTARWISSHTLHGQRTNIHLGNEALDEGHRNFALTQWAQFIEHDLSKSVATSMKSGQSIQCCQHDSYKLQPRFIHPACAPLVGKDPANKHGRDTCLNYVRSALTVGAQCNFGAAEQLNQATGYLDLSQLYGYTNDVQQRMRLHRDGKMKSTSTSTNPMEDMLPLATENPFAFCALRGDSNENCYMSGDSRVNNNPFTIVLHTMFMRSHNRIAAHLQQRNVHWDDELLFNSAKNINVQIYRRVVLDEWMPTVLGKRLADAIKAEESLPKASLPNESRLQISNEFAVAAIRFYFSMLPNVLHDLATTATQNNNISPTSDLFVLKDQLYKSQSLNKSQELDHILESLLQQRSMKMDSTYADSFIQSYTGTNLPTRSDVLAFDIQRGRDHGLQGYVKYLEICEGIQVTNWNDLEKYINANDLDKLKTTYDSWLDVDLIVGGISEQPSDGSSVGPTFSCILAEQFSKMYQWQQMLDRQQTKFQPAELNYYRNWNGSFLLCATSQVKDVPRNIFEIPSIENPLLSCAAMLQSEAVVQRPKHL